MREKKSRKIAAALACACVLALAAATSARLPIWENNLTLWSDTEQKNPQSYSAANNLGWALLVCGEPQKTIDPFRRAIELSHEHEADPFAGLALAFDELQKPAESAAALRRAISIDPRYAEPQQLVPALVLDAETARKLELLLKANTKH